MTDFLFRLNPPLSSLPSFHSKMKTFSLTKLFHFKNSVCSFFFQKILKHGIKENHRFISIPNIGFSYHQ